MKYRNFKSVVQDEHYEYAVLEVRRFFRWRQVDICRHVLGSWYCTVSDKKLPPFVVREQQRLADIRKLLGRDLKK